MGKVKQMKEKRRKRDFDKKLNKKMEECDSIIEITSKAMEGLNVTQKKILFTKESLESTKYNAQWNKKVLGNIRDEKIYQIEPSFDGYFKSYNTGVTGLQDFSRELLGSIKDVENRMGFISGAISNSDANMATGCRILGNFLDDNKSNNVVNSIALENPWNNPFSQRDSLKEKLLLFKGFLADTLDNLWDSLLFTGRNEENRTPALLMREFISDFLNTLSPRLDILKLDWCKKTKSGNPTQHSKVIFAILGPDESFSWKKKNYKPLVEIATVYRKLYKILNGFTHYRGGGTPNDVRIKLTSFAEQLQSYTLEILKLRAILL